MNGKRFTSLAAFLFLASLFLSGQVEAQVYVPPVSAAACAECGGVGSHKPSCPHYRSSQGDSDSQSTSNKPVTSSSNRGDEPYSDSNFFGLIDGKPLTNKEYWTILMDICPYCGARNNKSHKSDCTIGYAFNMWHEYSNSGREKDAIRMRDNIVTLKLASSRGKATLASMRNPSASKPSSSGTSSTSLRYYTPAPEKPKPAVGQPIMSCPLASRVPQFSSVNTHNIVYDKLQSVDGEHPWGKVDMDALRKSIARGWGDFTEYDIERYSNTPKGVVILGKRIPNGGTKWMRLMYDEKSGKYLAYTSGFETTDNNGKTVFLQDVRLEAEGRIVVAEYSGGFKSVSNIYGRSIVSGYDVSILPFQVEGNLFISYTTVTRSGSNLTGIYDDQGHKIAYGQQFEYYQDAIIARYNDSKSATLYNWKGQSIYFDKGGWKSNYVDDIRCYNSDKGPYYLIKVKDGQYTIIARGFRQVGGTYSSEDEAHEAMRRL